MSGLRHLTEDGRYIHIGAGNMPTWRRLTAVMGREDLPSEPHPTDQVASNAHEDEIDEIVGEWTARHALEEFEAVLEEAAVPAARIYTMEDIFSDLNYAARSAIVCTMYRSN